jgi:hypothetical protein
MVGMAPAGAIFLCEFNAQQSEKKQLEIDNRSANARLPIQFTEVRPSELRSDCIQEASQHESRRFNMASVFMRAD